MTWFRLCSASSTGKILHPMLPKMLPNVFLHHFIWCKFLLSDRRKSGKSGKSVEKAKLQNGQQFLKIGQKTKKNRRFWLKTPVFLERETGFGAEVHRKKTTIYCVLWRILPLYIVSPKNLRQIYANKTGTTYESYVEPPRNGGSFLFSFFDSRNIAFRPRSIFFESSATCSGLSKLGTQGKTRLHTGNIEFNTFLPFTCHKVSNNKLCPLLFPLFWAQARGKFPVL